MLQRVVEDTISPPQSAVRGGKLGQDLHVLQAAQRSLKAMNGELPFHNVSQMSSSMGLPCMVF